MWNKNVTQTLSLKHLRWPTWILFVLPLVSIVILCIMFGDGVVKHVPFGIVDLDNSSTSRMIVQYVEENEMFDVKMHGLNETELETALTNGDIVAGIIIPRDFGKDVVAGNTPTILQVYDGCQMSMVAFAKTRMAEVMMTIKAAASMKILEQKLNLSPDQALSYVQPIAVTYRFMGNPEKSIRSYMLSGALASIVQIAVYIFMVEAIRKEDTCPVEEEGCWDMWHPLYYMFVAALFGTLSLVSCIAIMHFFFGFPMEGSWLLLIGTTFLNMFFIAGFGAFMRLLMPTKIIAVQMSSLVMAMLLFSGFTYPTIAMPRPFQIFAGWLPFTHYVIPMRDILLLGKGMDYFLPDIGYLINSCIVAIIVVCLLWPIFLQRRSASNEEVGA